MPVVHFYNVLSEHTHKLTVLLVALYRKELGNKARKALWFGWDVAKDGISKYKGVFPVVNINFHFKFHGRLPTSYLLDQVDDLVLGWHQRKNVMQCLK